MIEMTKYMTITITTFSNSHDSQLVSCSHHITTGISVTKIALVVLLLIFGPLFNRPAKNEKEL